MRAVAAGLVALLVPAGPAFALTTEPGFSAQAVIKDLNQPTALSFAPDGRVFVAQKGGVIKVFPSVPAVGSSPLSGALASTTFADLSSDVHDVWDKGLLGLAVSPNWTADKSVYALYTSDAVFDGVGRWNDSCPGTEAGVGDGTGEGCQVSSRLVRLTSTTTAAPPALPQSAGTPTTLISDWCMQFPSHSIGTLAFGPDGKLYASGGDGASFLQTDFGQFGRPTNPCGDGHAGDQRDLGNSSANPPVRVPQNEAGALRSQDYRTTSGPVGLDGTIIRIDPATGAGVAGNPGFASMDANRKRIVAIGLRNPFRFTFRPGTSEIWGGDVGPDAYEEINRLENPLAAAPANFGWPCSEGNFTPGVTFGVYASKPLCSALGAATTAPYYSYEHGTKKGPIPGDDQLAQDPCPPQSNGGSSTTGVAFEPSDASGYPAAYRGALFFADWAKNCIWVMKAGANGLPDVNRVEHFVRGVGAVQLVVGPPGTPYAGDLFYVNIGQFDGNGGAIKDSGEIRRVHFGSAPTAVITADQTTGPAPLAVSLSGASSSNPEGGPLTFAWDLDDNGTFETNGVTVATSYGPGHHTANLQVTSSMGVKDFTSIELDSGAPIITISTPTAALHWKVGDKVDFAGNAIDAEEGVLPESALKWTLNLRHCEVGNGDACHNHGPLVSSTGATGSFSTPDHGYPSYLVLTVSVTDVSGARATQSVRLDPTAISWLVDTKPSGGVVSVGATAAAGPLKKTVVAVSGTEVDVASPQVFNGVTRAFVGWSDNGASSHVAIAPATDGSLIATFTNGVPVAKLSSDRTDGKVPFVVNFDASDSSDPDAAAGDTITYAWDLDGDGLFDDGTSAKIAKTYVTDGATKVRVRVTDRAGAQAIAKVDIGGVALTQAELQANPCKKNTFVARYFVGSKANRVPFLTRCEKAVNARWGLRRPVTGAPKDHFFVRWAGTFDFTGGTTRFKAIGDDGIRVWIDGKLIVNHWKGKVELSTIDRPLTRGKHAIRVEYIERTGTARALLTWAKRR